MTAKEAIEILSGLAVPIHAEPAYDMAIAALEVQEEKHSTESSLTQKPLDATNISVCDMVSISEVVDMAGKSEWFESSDAYNDFVWAIHALPSAQELANNSKKLDSGNGDSISRAAAMTEIKMIAERYTLAHEKMGEGRVEWSEYLVRMSDAFDVVRNLPSVKPYKEENV